MGISFPWESFVSDIRFQVRHMLIRLFPFYIGEDFMDEAILHAKDIDPANMTWLACGISPGIAPMRDAAAAKTPGILNFALSLGRFSKERLPKGGDGFLAGEYSAIGSWGVVFKGAVISDELHHPGNIMTIEGLIEG
jgi:hypothetical protein